MSSANKAKPTGALLSDDLLFSSRITSTASATGREMKVARTVDELLQTTGQWTISCIILDVEHSELRLEELVPQLRERCAIGAKIVGYGSHVNVASLRAAREAGCDLVLPRSAFVDSLSAELSNWFALSPTHAAPPKAP